MRLFVAVDVPAAVKEAIEENIVAPLRETIAGARWTKPEGRHLTLSFLGEVDEDRVPGIRDELGAACDRHHAFEASFSEVGGFPNLRRARVLWVGLRAGAEEAAALAGSIDDRLGPLGFERQRSPFTAHLTLARFTRPHRIGLPEVGPLPGGFAVSEVILFRSRLHPRGARYEALERIPLAP